MDSHVRLTTGRGSLELLWFDVSVSWCNLGLGLVVIVRIIPPLGRKVTKHHDSSKSPSSHYNAARSAGQWKESQAGRTSGGQLGVLKLPVEIVLLI